MKENISVYPVITYRDEVEAPYIVAIKTAAYSDLLHQMGMQNDEIRALKLEVSRKDSDGAHYSPSKRAIFIQTDKIYSDYQNYLKVAEDIAPDVKQPRRIRVGKKILYESNPFKHILYTKKLVNYLQTAPPERGLAFAEKIILNGVNRELNGDLLHETRHALDKPKGGNRLMQGLALLGLAGGGWISFSLGRRYDMPLVVNIIIGLFCAALYAYTGMGIGHALAPGEIRARGFESKFKNHPYWRDIIEIRPKSRLLHPIESDSS